MEVAALVVNMDKEISALVLKCWRLRPEKVNIQLNKVFET